MDLPTILIGGTLAIFARVYPETRLIRYLLFKLNINNKQVSVLTAIIAFLFDAALSFSINGFHEGSIFILLSIVPILWLMIIDIKRDSSSKLIKFIKSFFFRYFVGFLAFLYFVIIFNTILKTLPGFNDPYYVTATIIAGLYTFLAFRKKSISDRYVICTSVDNKQNTSIIGG